MQQDEVKTMKKELIQEVKHSVGVIQRVSLTHGVKGPCLRCVGQSRFEIAPNQSYKSEAKIMALAHVSMRLSARIVSYVAAVTLNRR